MNPLHFDPFGAPEATSEAIAHAAVLMPRAALALAAGALIAWRPWRRRMGLPPVKADMAQAQALLCVVGALMVGIIGDNVARAFGLVGLGGLIRFRAALKDPRDGAVFFLLIALGMAAGMGAYVLVVSGTVFVVLVLAVLDRTWRTDERKKARMRVFVQCERPLDAERMLRPALALAQVTVKRSSANETTRTLEMLVDEPGPGAVARVLAGLSMQAESVRCEADQGD